MITAKIYFGVAVVGILILHTFSLPQSINFGRKPSAADKTKDKKDVNPRLGLVASVLGKTYRQNIVYFDSKSSKRCNLK